MATHAIPMLCSVESAGNSNGPGPPRRLQMPAAKQGDLREHLTRMRMGSPGPQKTGPPNGRAPENGRPHFDTFFPAPKPAEEEEAPAPPREQPPLSEDLFLFVCLLAVPPALGNSLWL